MRTSNGAPAGGHWRRLTLATLLCATLALLAGPLNPARAGSAITNVVATKVGGDFDQAIFASAAPGYGRLLFVVERAGVIRVMRGDQQLRKPFLNIRDRVDTTGEGGLLSVAFPPDYRRSGRFYVYFTDNSNDVRVTEFRRAGKKSLRARPGSSRAVIEVPHPNDAFNHNGGTAMFGPDGMLWLAPGDGGSTPGAATNLKNLRGKLLRINPVRKRGRPGYNVPRGNPYVGRRGRDEIWAEGLRNPFRFSFDGRNIAIGDVGGGSREEVNFLPISDARGADFGWPRFEGDEGQAGPSMPRLRDPIYDYQNPADDPAAVTGGIVSRDPRLSGDMAPSAGRYLYADVYNAEGPNPQSFRADPQTQFLTDRQPLVNVSISSIAAFARGAQLQNYVVSLASGVYRLDPAP